MTTDSIYEEEIILNFYEPKDITLKYIKANSSELQEKIDNL